MSMKKIGKLLTGAVVCSAAAAAAYCLVQKFRDSSFGGSDSDDPEDESYVEPAEPGPQREYVSLSRTPAQSRETDGQAG